MWSVSNWNKRHVFLDVLYPDTLLPLELHSTLGPKGLGSEGNWIDIIEICSSACYKMFGTLNFRWKFSDLDITFIFICKIYYCIFRLSDWEYKVLPFRKLKSEDISGIRLNTHWICATKDLLTSILSLHVYTYDRQYNSMAEYLLVEIKNRCCVLLILI
jgi:hypothetical protein